MFHIYHHWFAALWNFTGNFKSDTFVYRAKVCVCIILTVESSKHTDNAAVINSNHIGMLMKSATAQTK